jgi:hypothetical protein
MRDLNPGQLETCPRRLGSSSSAMNYDNYTFIVYIISYFDDGSNVDGFCCSLIIQGRINSMTYSIPRQTNIRDFFHSFDSTNSQITYDSLVTFTDEYKDKVTYQNNTFFYSRHRQGCSKRTDPCNPWRLPEEPDDCSRADIARTYRLGAGF